MAQAPATGAGETCEVHLHAAGSHTLHGREHLYGRLCRNQPSVGSDTLVHLVLHPADCTACDSAQAQTYSPRCTSSSRTHSALPKRPTLTQTLHAASLKRSRPVCARPETTKSHTMSQRPRSTLRNRSRKPLTRGKLAGGIETPCTATARRLQRHSKRQRGRVNAPRGRGDTHGKLEPYGSRTNVC